MEELRKLYGEAAAFRARRAALAAKLKEIDARHQERLDKLERDRASRAKALEKDREAGLAACDARTQRDISSYVEMKSTLQSFAAPVRHLCPQEAIRAYRPNPARVNEAEVNRLIEMVQEQGIIAWFKRTFRLGGYASRGEMALSLFEKVEDACAYCNLRIQEAESASSAARQELVTEGRRKLQAAADRHVSDQKAEEERYKLERAQALDAIRTFDSSAELRELHDRIRRLYQESENVCGAWGEYTAPAAMPERVKLCGVGVTLPDSNGIDHTVQLPLWLDLYACNIIVITGGNSAAAGTDCAEKRMVRSLLARMLKTVPPEFCSYSVFDSLHKGGSLERLIDVTNAGTTDLSFDLFTSNESDGKTVSCAERRKYLRNRPAEIIKFTAGRSRSLFEHNRESGDFEFPFTWVVDFNFPDDPDDRMMDDMKELFVNADAAGYSFVFVAGEQGFEKIRALAETYTDVPVLRVDCVRKVCSQADLELPLAEAGSPSPEQIYNFMTALKKFYDEGGAIDNRLNTVLSASGIQMRDAAKKLTIPMALDSRGRLVDIEFGGEGSVHGFVSGGTNSGKSTLLHTIILSACLHYHPNDLEIWLIDYKQTEFYLYKKRTPPHIKLIGVSKTPDFTFSLLDKIEEEANRRTNLMNRFGAQNLAEYRKHQGEPGYENITRLFLVIDEFHEMSQFVSTEMEYKDKLENILREYRAQGITCLMADQTFSTGLSGLTSAAKNQIGLRIAMRNEASPQEIKDTLEVDRALYSDSMQRTIAIMSQGEFIMKVYVRNARGELTDIRLEKFKGLYTQGGDIAPVSKALQGLYRGQYNKDDLIYVNTKDQVPWSDAEPAALDRLEPLRYPNVRLYLGRSATLRPCFGLDLGRQPDENLAIVGGSAFQRWELLASIIHSCRCRGYKMWVFMAEYSDLASDFGRDIREACAAVPEVELFETTAQWCGKLAEIDDALTEKRPIDETICVFIGLEIANVELSRLPDRGGSGGGSSFLSAISRYAAMDPGGAPAPEAQSAAPEEFNALPIIDRLFSSGARNGVRCITEVSVYRQFSKILRVKDMCRHKVAFSMSADDCLMYLGNSNYQKNIGQFAVYSNGGKEVKKLLPYHLEP